MICSNKIIIPDTCPLIFEENKSNIRELSPYYQKWQKRDVINLQIFSDEIENLSLLILDNREVFVKKIAFDEFITDIDGYRFSNISYTVDLENGCYYFIIVDDNNNWLAKTPINKIGYFSDTFYLEYSSSKNEFNTFFHTSINKKYSDNKYDQHFIINTDNSSLGLCYIFMYEGAVYAFVENSIQFVINIFNENDVSVKTNITNENITNAISFENGNCVLLMSESEVANIDNSILYYVEINEKTDYEARVVTFPVSIDTKKSTIESSTLYLDDLLYFTSTENNEFVSVNNISTPSSGYFLYVKKKCYIDMSFFNAFSGYIEFDKVYSGEDIITQVQSISGYIYITKNGEIILTKDLSFSKIQNYLYSFSISELITEKFLCSAGDEIEFHYYIYALARADSDIIYKRTIFINSVGGAKIENYSGSGHGVQSISVTGPQGDITLNGIAYKIASSIYTNPLYFYQNISSDGLSISDNMISFSKDSLFSIKGDIIFIGNYPMWAQLCSIFIGGHEIHASESWTDYDTDSNFFGKYFIVFHLDYSVQVYAGTVLDFYYKIGFGYREILWPSGMNEVINIESYSGEYMSFLNGDFEHADLVLKLGETLYNSISITEILDENVYIGKSIDFYIEDDYLMLIAVEKDYQFSIRIDGTISPNGDEYKSEKSDYMDMEEDNVFLFGNPYTIETLYIGNNKGVPSTIRKKLNQILQLPELRLNYRDVTKANGVETFEQKEIISDTGNSILTLKVQIADTTYVNESKALTYGSQFITFGKLLTN